MTRKQAERNPTKRHPQALVVPPGLDKHTVTLRRNYPKEMFVALRKQLDPWVALLDEIGSDRFVTLIRLKEWKMTKRQVTLVYKGSIERRARRSEGGE